MARKDALLRLHSRLVQQRAALRRKFADELNIAIPSPTSGRDVGDAASDGSFSELNSQLAALESRELGQIERAIEMIREGRYGLCEVCDEKIPLTRLKALPFTPYCVECQRRQEVLGIDPFNSEVDWESAYEHEGRLNDRELTLRDIDVD